MFKRNVATTNFQAHGIEKRASQRAGHPRNPLGRRPTNPHRLFGCDHDRGRPRLACSIAISKCATSGRRKPALGAGDHREALIAGDIFPEKFSTARSAAANGLGPAKSPASHGRRTTLRPALRGEEPAACEPGRGGRGGTGIAESSCDGDVGCPTETTSHLYCATQC